MNLQESIRRMLKPLQKCRGFLFHKKIILVVKKNIHIFVQQYLGI